MEDHIVPSGKWAFDDKVAECFDDMLKRSIPQIDIMRATVTDLAVKYVKPNTSILDLGCSRGDAIAPLIPRSPSTCEFVGLEISEPMRKIAKQRFLLNNDVKILDFDLRNRLDNLKIAPSVVLSILTLQFVPMEYRQGLIQDVYNKMRSDGAFILVEKVLGSCAEIDQHLVSLYYEGKKANGYTQEDIDRKRMSLEGVLVPMTASWNEDMLRQAGFKKIDCFWRYLNFAGWIAVK